MVLCQFYLNNNCRFGSKCNNEHLDVRATIKQEMEAAIKGRQWPLSVFGPFKEKINLIPDEYDLSFEECRMQFLQSQASNTFPMYQQQLMQKIQEANLRMQSLLNVNKDVLQVAVNIYNESDSGVRQGNAIGVSSGGFGGNSTNINAFGSNVNAASIFGGVAKSTSMFGGGISSMTQQTQNAASIFGGSQPSFSSAQNNANSIFGGGNQSSGGFGMSTAQPGSVFGGTMTNTATPSSLFGSNVAQQNSTSLFGQSSTFGTQQPQQSIFSKTNAPTFGSSAFGNAAASVFGTQAHQPNQNLSSFGMQSTPSFAGSSTPFAAQIHQTNVQPTNSNIFGNLGQQASQAALATFTNQMPTHQQNISPFGAPPPPPAFGSNVQVGSIHSHGHDPTLYSKMEDLSQEQMAAFQADGFILGQIPNVAPPKELC